jgi:hypothetical protein
VCIKAFKDLLPGDCVLLVYPNNTSRMAIVVKKPDFYFGDCLLQDNGEFFGVIRNKNFQLPVYAQSEVYRDINRP